MKVTATAAAAALFFLVTGHAFAQEPTGMPVSAQLYTVRNVGTLDEQLATIARAGIHYVEPFQFFGMPEVPLDQFTALLTKHGLKVSGMHIGLGDLAENTDHIVEYNKALGNTRLIVPMLRAGIQPDDKAGWQAMGQVFGILASRLKAKGMKLGLHNHTDEMKVFDGKTAFEWFAEAAGPDVILTLDVAWAARGGQDPAALLGRLKGRVWNIHVKDNAPAGTAPDEGGFATVGKGTLDWDRILPAAHAAGVTWFTLEHDKPKDPGLALKEGNAFLTPKLAKILGER